MCFVLWELGSELVPLAFQWGGVAMKVLKLGLEEKQTGSSPKAVSQRGFNGSY